MKKTILIPTDFSVLSLNVLKAVLTQSDASQKYDVILLHGFNLGDSIRDLLFYSKSQQMAALMNSDFEEAYEVIRNKFDSQIASLKIDFFTGYNLSAFNSYLEVNKIMEIYTSDIKFTPAHKSSFDLSRFIAKCHVEAQLIETVTKPSVAEKGKITEVFISAVSA